MKIDQVLLSILRWIQKVLGKEQKAARYKVTILKPGPHGLLKSVEGERPNAVRVWVFTPTPSESLAANFDIWFFCDRLRNRSQKRRINTHSIHVLRISHCLVNGRYEAFELFSQEFDFVGLSPFKDMDFFARQIADCAAEMMLYFPFGSIDWQLEIDVCRKARLGGYL